MGLLGRLDEPSLEFDVVLTRRDRLLVEGPRSGERRHAHRIEAGAVEERMGDIGIHVEHEPVDLLPGKIIFREERVGDHEGQVHRPLPRGPFEADHFAKVGERLALAAVAGECLGTQRLHLREHLLATGIVERREVADEDGDLHDLLRVGVAHLLRRAIGVEAEAGLAAGVVERLLVREGLDLVRAPQFLGEPTGILPRSLAAECRGQNEPRPIPLGKRVHRLGVDFPRAEPGGRQPAALTMGFGGDRGAEADDDQQPDAGVREGDRFHANGSLTESMGPWKRWAARKVAATPPPHQTGCHRGRGRGE